MIAELINLITDPGFAVGATLISALSAGVVLYLFGRLKTASR